MKRSNKRLRLGCRAGLRCLSRSTSSPNALQAPLRGRWRAPFTSASCGERSAPSAIRSSRETEESRVSSVASLRYACSSARGQWPVASGQWSVASQSSLCRFVSLSLSLSHSSIVVNVVHLSRLDRPIHEFYT